MGLSFRIPHRYASILWAGSFTSNFRIAKLHKAEVAGNVDRPAWVGIEEKLRGHYTNSGALFY